MNQRIRRPVPPRPPQAAPQLRSGYYRDPSVLNGGPAVSLLTWLFVLLAAIADLTAFYTVVALLFKAQPVIVWLATVGFTAVGVGLAHQIGVGFRQRRSADRRFSAIVWASLVAWLGLGAAAFVVRWFVVQLSTALGAGTGFPSDAGPAAPAVDRPLLAAIFFLVLFVASGLLAGFVGFQNYNPDATALERARKVRSLAAARRETSVAALAELRAVRASFVEELERVEQHRAAMRQSTEASVYELKNRARLLLSVGRAADEVQDIMEDAPRPAATWSRPSATGQP